MRNSYPLKLALTITLLIVGSHARTASAQSAAGGSQTPGDPPKPVDAKPSKPADPKPPAKPADGKGVTAASAKSIYEFTMPDIDGKETPLSKYKGKVLLIVNTASKCGYTPQYEGLEAMYEKHAAQGLAIAAFPANNFGGQEPGTNSEIKTFCSTRYAVTFDVFSKVSVKGDDCCELFQYLIANSPTNSANPDSSSRKDAGKAAGNDIKWNFTKFLIDRNGKIVARFEPKDTPEKMAAQVEKLLAEKAADRPEKDAKPVEPRPN